MVPEAPGRGQDDCFIPAIHADGQGKWDGIYTNDNRRRILVLFLSRLPMYDREKTLPGDDRGEPVYGKRHLVNLKNKDVSVYGNISYGPFAS